jgi:hypothetical protein
LSIGSGQRGGDRAQLPQAGSQGPHALIEQRRDPREMTLHVGAPQGGSLSAQLREPSENFVRFVAGEIPATGRLTQKVIERLTPVLRKADSIFASAPR